MTEKIKEEICDNICKYPDMCSEGVLNELCSNCVISNDNSNYWNNICELQSKQTEKGIKTYGQTLEQNTSLTDKERIIMIEEEMIDALMYLEHLKSGIKTNKELAYRDGKFDAIINQANHDESIKQAYELGLSDGEIKACSEGGLRAAYEQGKKETYTEILNKIDEGFCFDCEHHDPDRYCWRTCGNEGYEKEVFIKWLKGKIDD